MSENQNEKMRVVECDVYECGHVFEIDESKIKKTGCNRHILHTKVKCPKCGKESNIVQDYEISKSNAERDRIKANSPISCPRCNSTQLYASDKGFSVGKALAGSIVVGNIGLLAGFHGSKKVMLTCLSCSHKWEVGK